MTYTPLFALLTTALVLPLAARADDKPPVEVQIVDDEGELYPRESAATSTPRAQEEAALDADADEARARIDALRSKKAHAEAQATPEADCAAGAEGGPWFWHKPTGVRQGDFLLTWHGGFGAGGGFGGGAAEWMFGERFGLRLSGTFDGIGPDSEFHGKVSGWDFTSGAWGVSRSAFGVSTQGFVGLVEPAVTYHFRPGERFDVYASAGVSAFAYRLDEARGGSALVRTGVGAQWFWRAIFVGAELGWYPIELARVTGRREGNVEIFRVDRAEEPFDARRATFIAHVGVRL